MTEEQKGIMAVCRKGQAYGVALLLQLTLTVTNSVLESKRTHSFKKRLNPS
jgi:hypothetical protein